MKRTKKQSVAEVENEVAIAVPDKKEIKWINNGGTFYLANKTRIASGASFMAAIDEVPQAFRKTVCPADPIEFENAQIAAVTDSEIADAVPLNYSIKQRKNTEYFDIFDARNKKLNDKNLTEAEAQDLVNKLMSE